MEDETKAVGTLQPDAARKKESIVLLVPMAGDVGPHFYQSSIMATVVAQKAGLDVRGTIVAYREVIQSARNHLAAAFLATDCDWAIWMDSDMVFPVDTIVKLWHWAKKLNSSWMTGCYYQRFAPHHPVMFRVPPRNQGSTTHTRFNHEHTTYATGRKTPFELDCAGFGCMLTHRSMFEKVEKPWFSFNSDPDRPTEESSEDFHFAVKARKCGFVLWGVPEVECGHIGDAPVYGRADYERCKKQEDYIETREQIKEKPINGRTTELPDTGTVAVGGNGKDHGPEEAAGKPELAQARPSCF